MFGKRIRLFRLLGFEVKIDASWLILALLITWTLATGYFPFRHPELAASAYWWMAIGGAAGLFVSIVIHEFAHSVIARRDGIPMKGITLFIFGGVAEMDQEPPTAGSEFRMAIAGPIASFLLAGAFYLIYLAGAGQGWPVSAAGTFHYLAFINAVLASFNLLPAFPLDGGRVLRSILWKRKGNIRRATRTSSNIGAGFGVGLIFLGVFSVLGGNFVGGMWWFLIGMFLRGASKMSYQQLEMRRALEGESISRFMRPDPVTVPPTISLQELIDDYVYKHHFRMFPVVRDSELEGCITVDEIKDVPKDRWSEVTTGEVMQKCSENNTVAPDTDAVETLSLMKRTGGSPLMVVREGRLAGVVSLKNLLGFLALKLDLEGEDEQQDAQRLAAETVGLRSPKERAAMPSR